MEGIHSLLEQYGLWAIAVGAFLQGYVFVVLAGVLATRGVFNSLEVLLLAAISSWTGHWFFYFLGYWFSKHRCYLSRTRIETPLKTFERTIGSYPWASVFIMQYGYGIRLVSAIAFGFFRVNFLWFGWAQLLNCSLWALVLFSGGFLAGLGIYALPSGAQLPIAVTGVTLVLVAVLCRRSRRLTTSVSIDQ
jgi:membrane protein DedA with SNARE-associated domain